MTPSFHFILVTWEILVHSSMSLTGLSARSKCHPGTSPVAFLGVFLCSHGLSHSGSHFLLWSCLPSGSVFLLASHQALLPASPQVPSAVFTPRCFCGGRGGFWQSLCVFWAYRFSLTPRLLELDLVSFLLLSGALQEWKKTIAILDPRFSLRTSLTGFFVFILLVPESETGPFQQSQKKILKMFLFVKCRF